MKRLRFLAIGAIMMIVPLAVFGFDLTVGVKGGGALPFFTGVDYRDLLELSGRSAELRLGYSVGAFMSIGITDFLAIQPEVLYSALGGNEGNSTNSYRVDARVIEVPVLLKARLRLGSVVVSPFAGPEVLIPLGAWTDAWVDKATGDVLLSGTFDMAAEIADVMVGLVAGAGVLIPLGDLSVSVEGRYVLSFTSIYLPSFYDFDQRQSAVQVLVAVGFGVVP